MAYHQNSYKKFIVGAVTTPIIGLSFTPIVGAKTFADIEGNSHQQAILSLVDQGIIKGYPDGTFKPYDSITRGDAAVMIARTLNLLDGKNIPTTTFKDLDQVNETTQEAIAKLADLEVISGFTPQSFKPQETVTRAQMAKFIVNAFQLTIPEEAEILFPDVDESLTLAPYVEAIAEARITIGKSDGTFGYFDNLNRGDFAGMIARTQEITQPVEPIIIEGDSLGDVLMNGSAKTYTVTLINPVSKKPIEGAALNVTFAENLNTNYGSQRNVTVTNGYGESNIPYQSNDGSKAEVKIYTDKNGKATFTITGSNATVTPIVFMDGSNQKWDTRGGIKIETQDGRFDPETEYHVKAESVTFMGTPYEVEVIGERTDFAAIAEFDEDGKLLQHNGRKYKIKVMKPDGKPYAGGIVNVGIEQLLDQKLGNEPTGAYFVDFQNSNGKHLTQGQVKLDANGEAEVVLASTDQNDSAKPLVWIDQNFANNFQPGTYEEGEPQSDPEQTKWTNFQPVRVGNGLLGAKLIAVKEPKEGQKDFTFTILNQSGNVFLPGQEVNAHVTFEVVNTGSHRIEVDTSLFQNMELTNILDAEKKQEKVVVEVGGRVTISGDTSSSTVTLSANAIEGISSLKLKGSAVLSPNVGSNSNAVYVYTDYIEAELPYSYEAEITSAIVKDTDNNKKNDQVIITFAKEVYNVEAGDFRVIAENGKNIEATGVKKDGKKLILSFSEDALAASSLKLNYDGHYSGTTVLTDQFGNKVIPFAVSIEIPEVLSAVVKDTDNTGKQVVVTFTEEVFRFKADLFHIIRENDDIITATKVIKDGNSLILFFPEGALLPSEKIELNYNSSVLENRTENKVLPFFIPIEVPEIEAPEDISPEQEPENV